jgi:hypothetical protein
VLPEINVTLIPEPKGVESLARQIRLTGRAYPIFEIAQLILRKHDRYQVRFSVLRKPEGEVIQPLWLCNLDDSAWLSEPEAVGHVLRKHFETFYQTEKTPTDPPKGTYTFVAQCGMSGTILGPPNFHDYQAKLARLHAARYSRMPFEAYKARVRIVRDEAVVKQWIEEQSFKTSFICLNVPEALTLPSMNEVEAHFRQVHLPNIIRTVDDWVVDGANAQRLPSMGLRQLARRAWDEQHRFPLKLVGVLSQQFASHGLQFFKVNKTVTHVAVARPHYLDLEATPVSDGIRRIVEHINSRPGTTRRVLLEALAPAPAQVRAHEPVAGTEPAAAPADSVEPEAGAQQAQTEVAASVKAAEPATPELTAEQTAVTADLHWLIHQGHVIEFATGKLETAKKPKPKPAPLPRAAATSQTEPAPAARSEPEAASANPPVTEAASAHEDRGSVDVLPAPPTLEAAAAEPAAEAESAVVEQPPPEQGAATPGEPGEPGGEPKPS